MARSTTRKPPADPEDAETLVNRLLGKRDEANAAMTRARRALKESPTPENQSALREAQGDYDFVRRQLRKAGWTSGRTRRPNATPRGPRGSIDVATLRKVVGAAETDRLLRLLNAAQVENIVLRPEQIRIARQWLDGERLGQRHNITAPVFKKFLLENGQVRAAFRAWLNELEKEKEEEVPVDGES